MARGGTSNGLAMTSSWTRLPRQIDGLQSEFACEPHALRARLNHELSGS